MLSKTVISDSSHLPSARPRITFPISVMRWTGRIPCLTAFSHSPTATTCLRSSQNTLARPRICSSSSCFPSISEPMQDRWVPGFSHRSRISALLDGVAVRMISALLTAASRSCTGRMSTSAGSDGRISSIKAGTLWGECGLEAKILLMFFMTFRVASKRTGPWAPVPTSSSTSDSGRARYLHPTAPAAPVRILVIKPPSIMLFSMPVFRSKIKMVPVNLGSPKSLFPAKALTSFIPKIPAPSMLPLLMSNSETPSSKEWHTIGNSSAKLLHL